MSNKNAVIPSLTQEGWITSSKDTLAYVLAHYILSDAQQSIAYRGNVTNLPETYYLHINDPTAMASAIKSDLERLLGAYFVTSDVVTDVKELTAKKYAILIYATVIDKDNIKHELTRITEANSAGIRNIIAMNNYGDGLAHLNSI